MKTLKFISFILIIIIANSCTFINKLSAEKANFEDIIQLSQNLIFNLNHTVAKEEEFDTWIDEELIEISPKVAGKFKWTDGNTLVFSPSHGFAPATVYTAVLNQELSKKINKNLTIDSEAITFHTPFPKLEKIAAYWSKGMNNEQINLKLNFNYEINTQEVAKYLSITKKSNNIPFEVQKNLVENEIILSLNEKLEVGDDLLINIEKGAKISNSIINENIEQEIEMPSKDVEIEEVTAEFDQNIGQIKVITNVEIKAENLEKFVSVVSSKTPEEGKTAEMKLSFDMLENGFLIHGEFNAEEVYNLLIKKGLTSKIESKLNEDYSKELTFGEMPQSINFSSSKAIYLSAKGNKNIGIKISNIPKVELKVSKIYENNILHFINSNRYSSGGDEYYDEESGTNSSLNNHYTYNQDSEQILSDIILEKKINTFNLPKSGGLSILNFNLPNQNRQKGIFLVSVNSQDEYYQNDTRIVSISDIGLITKKGLNELFVFTNSIHSTDALNDVEISLISTNNQLITTKKTDKNGIAVFENLKDILGNYKVAMITARTIDDFNYMVFDGSEVETSRFEVEGKRENSSGFDAFIYGDRNIYRPGETVNFVSIVRSDKWSTVKDVPLKIILLMPNGKEYFSAQKTTNEQGAIEISIPIDKSSITGVYNFEVLNGNDVLLNSKAINIEEFMPDRIKVDLSSDKEFYSTGNDIKISATATNMFGPPAVGNNYEMEMKLSKVQFSPKKYKNYKYNFNKVVNFENEIREGKTLEKGLASENFKISDDYKDMGLLEAKMYVTVFDESSRPVNRLKKLNIYTQAIFYGIKMYDNFVGTNVATKFDLIALNKSEIPTTSNAIIEFVRTEYNTVIEKSEEGYRYISKKQIKIIQSKKVNLKDGFGSINFTPVVSGEYEIRIKSEGAEGWSSQEFYAYQYGSTENSSFEVNNEGNIDISFDKENYQSGEKAKILFKTPFVGKMLVTIERNKILEHHYLTTDKKSAELIINLGKEHLPNVFVSATLFRPMNGENIPLTVAHGYASTLVSEKANLMPIEIIAEDKSRSNTKQKIKIKTGKPNSQITVAVVDEGILQVKNFKTPDIYNHFYQKRALEVASYDLYPFLFPEIEIQNTSSVGGDGYDLEKRVNPLSNGRVELVAIWSGILKTNQNGEASFDFDIPQFTGDLRIMAIGFKDESFGSANKNMLVADPIVINTAMPRFLSPSDELTVPVSLHNTTKTPLQINVSAITSGGLIIDGIAASKLLIPAEKEGRVIFSLKAPNTITEGSVTILVEGNGEKFKNKTNITVRSASSLLKSSQMGMIATEKTEIINLTKNFIESTAKHDVLISHSPLIKITNHIKNLLDYPHGCVEQTTSKAFPQIYFASLAKDINYNKITTKTENDFNPNFNVQRAINKLETMQTSSGGLSFWQGGEDAFWWGSAYASHFLIEAKKAGFEVNKSFLNKLISYLSTSVNTNKPDDNFSYYAQDGSVKVKIITKPEVIYSLYVLAISGNPNRALMNYYKQNSKKLLTSSQFLLASAFQLIGDNNSYHSILPKQFNEDKGANYNNENLYSPIRNLALSLNSLLDSDPNNLMIPALARQLSVAVEGNKNLNTQEQSFAFLALGKFLKKSGTSTMKASISSNGKFIEEFNGKNIKIQNLTENISLKTSGSGSLYYFVESEGLSKSGKVLEEDKTLKVRRNFYTREGLLIKDNVFKQNQLIVVKLSMESANETAVKRIVLTDILPAGFEIENPRISPERELEWIKDQEQPEHFDIRDDRINFFTTAGKTKNYYYLVRAVSKGKFNLGPASADAMYQSEYRSYHGAGVITVR